MTNFVTLGYLDSREDQAMAQRRETRKRQTQTRVRTAFDARDPRAGRPRRRRTRQETARLVNLQTNPNRP